MAKVLRGSNRQAWAFMCENWQELAKLSALPLLAFFAITIFQNMFLVNALSAVAASTNAGNFSSAVSNAHFVSALNKVLLGLVGLLVIGWLFASIVRFTWTREASWLMNDKTSMRAALLTILYGLGMLLLGLLAFFAIAFASFLTLGQLPGILPEGTLDIGLIFLISAPILGVLYTWFQFRFLVGLPGIALGHSLHFFRDIWPLARGERWGIPLRVIALSVPVSVLQWAITFLALQHMQAAAKSISPNSRTADFLLLVEHMIYWQPLYTALSIIVFTPFFWFFTLLLTTAYHRFSQRQQHR
jgi:uncharacterized membrane protein